RSEDGIIVHNPPRHTINISDLPPKSYHLVDIEPYAALSDRRWIYYTSSHGCPYDCSFCSNASIYGRAWNALPANRVVAEVVELVQRFRLDLVDIVDDNFLVDRERVVDIAQGVIQSGVKFYWCIQTTANFLLRSSEEDVRLLRQSGLPQGLTGPQSGSDGVFRSSHTVRLPR